MKKPARNAPPDIDSLILEVCGQKLILDQNLASIYSVPTKRLNEQVKRNARLFPADFMFRLTVRDLVALRSQNSMAESGSSDLASNSTPPILKSQIATSSFAH